MSDKTENLIKLIENELAENPEKNINIKSYIDTTALEIILGKKKRSKKTRM